MQPAGEPQLPSKVEMIINLAVENDDIATAGGAHGLRPALRSFEDREPAMTQRDALAASTKVAPAWDPGDRARWSWRRSGANASLPGEGINIPAIPHMRQRSAKRAVGDCGAANSGKSSC